MIRALRNTPFSTILVAIHISGHRRPTDTACCIRSSGVRAGGSIPSTCSSHGQVRIAVDSYNEICLMNLCRFLD